MVVRLYMCPGRTGGLSRMSPAFAQKGDFWKYLQLRSSMGAGFGLKIEARSKFTHYTIVHRYYFTSLKLYKMGLRQDNKC